MYRVFHILEGYYYAVKKIKIEVPQNFDVRDLDIYREISTMVNLQHKNIVRFITSWLEQERQKETQENDSNDLSIHFGNTEKLAKERSQVQKVE